MVHREEVKERLRMKGKGGMGEKEEKNRRGRTEELLIKGKVGRNKEKGEKAGKEGRNGGRKRAVFSFYFFDNKEKTPRLK